ncbi:MAG: hypothetical protein IPM98_13450 [Lewinellaceae bacterium]|nr:hypothetical protein [Lewinellaceae bacterium]
MKPQGTPTGTFVRHFCPMITWLKNICFVWLALPAALSGQGQFNIQLDTTSIPGLPGLHSFAYATHAGKWLLIGGRRDGMHPKFGGFNTNNANQNIWVVDPAARQVWQRPIDELPDTLQEQLRSANMEFLQHGETLLFVGGYGQSALKQNHITYPYLTLVNVPGLVQAVQGSAPLQPHFQQIRDTFFAVTGGQLQRLADTFYLVGGHRFDGVYSANSDNPTQTYTNAIRKFTHSGGQVTHQSAVTDELNLHRRDYNLTPTVFQNGELGLTAFSGVFQPGLALAPFLNIVEIRAAAGHTSVNGFSQFLANYHCARVPLYAQSANEMHTLFFGGISQYWLDGQGILQKDGRLPFVKTISRVTRLADGAYEEVAFDTELPYHTGTSSEFILAEGVPTQTHDMVDYDALPDGTHLLGYIVGGIVTPENQRNPFVANTVGITSASGQIIQVFLQKNTSSAAPEKALDGRYNLKLSVSPNPARDRWQVRLNLPGPGRLRCVLQDAQGKIVRWLDRGEQLEGVQEFTLSAVDLPAGVYQLTLNLDGVFVETKTIVKQ